MSDAPACGTCRFREGPICRRMPPQVVPSANDNQHPQLFFPGTWWPEVHEKDWCGEWKEKT